MIETRLAQDLVSDVERAFFEPLTLSIRAPNGCTPTNHRLVLDGVFWIARTDPPRRDVPEAFGKWSSAYRPFRRWALTGLWEQILEALAEGRVVPDALQMVDGTVIRANHQAAAAKGTSRPRSTSL